MKTCLFVIDVQESFRDCDYFNERELAPYLVRQNALIHHCIQHNIPIVRVLHTDDDESFRLSSGKVVPLQGLHTFYADKEVLKTRHSAFIGTDLAIWLVQQGIKHIIISGIRTEQCCETTTRHASDLGYQVTYALDATLTFDMTMKDGNVLTSDMIQQRTETVLQDRFANVVDVATIMAIAELQE